MFEVTYVIAPVGEHPPTELQVHFAKHYRNCPQQQTLYPLLATTPQQFTKITEKPGSTGACGSVVVKALYYKPEGRGFDS
jgi:hypothetical protein